MILHWPHSDTHQVHIICDGPRELSNESHIMPPVSCLCGLRVNTIPILRSNLRLRGTCSIRTAPSHVTQVYLFENFHSYHPQYLTCYFSWFKFSRPLGLWDCQEEGQPVAPYNTKDMWKSLLWSWWSMWIRTTWSKNAVDIIAILKT